MRDGMRVSRVRARGHATTNCYYTLLLPLLNYDYLNSTRRLLLTTTTYYYLPYHHYSYVVLLLLPPALPQLLYWRCYYDDLHYYSRK